MSNRHGYYKLLPLYMWTALKYDDVVKKSRDLDYYFGKF